MQGLARVTPRIHLDRFLLGLDTLIIAPVFGYRLD